MVSPRDLPAASGVNTTAGQPGTEGTYSPTGTLRAERVTAPAMRALGLAAGEFACAGCQFAGVPSQVLAARCLHMSRLGHRKMEPRPPRHRQPSVKDLAEQVMAEPRAAGFVVLQDSGADGAIDERHHHLGGRPPDGGDHRDRDAPPDDRGDAEQLHDLTRQPGEAAN